MRIDVLTLFPRMFDGPFAESIVKRAQDAGLVAVHVHDVRDWAADRHRTVDDTPYGGGPGMVMRPEPLTRAIRAVRAGDGHVVLLSAQGRPFDEPTARRLADLAHLVLVAGHYEGVDERVIEGDVDEEISIGDYVLTGGELPAMVVVDAVTRLVPGVIEKASLVQESHTGGLLEGPQYTRPVDYEGRRVPPVLLSGDHKAIAEWRRAGSINRTAERRPDLLPSADLTPEERARLPRPAARRPRVSDEELVRAYRSGVGSYRIAARFGVSPATVRARLRDAGVRMRPAKGAPRGPTAAEVHRMRKTGMTIRDLAKHFGVSHVTIIDRLRRSKA
ncbi:MAG: tRNA (guanosine(37)-N1)-methyltransferase TrmD [Chloroflexota bacterium]|nr:tRNA (guanosine(37)-N1)-methyltransferase TrmD [Chloroflexota bacterium]MDE3100805.1 tRNA (guanosine(37)-N1)-methyltransferase TrmD [Chloroflexota bacterium]